MSQDLPPMNTVPELLLRETRVADLDLSTIYRAILEAKGNMSAAARALECSSSRLRDRINKLPAFVSLLAEFREFYVDKAEDNIFADVEKGDQSASKFILSTLGKERGYTQGVSGSGKGGEIEISIRTFAEPEQKGTP